MSDSPSIQLVGKAHGRLVHRRRIAVLAERLTAMLPPASTLLDVGCGDGTIARLISEAVPGLTISGAEYAPRPDCAIPCLGFDGLHLPFPDKSLDGCMFVDVLHHSQDPLAILRDAARVSRDFILIKDHVAESTLDHWTLRVMDWVGNRPHGVELPYAYLSQEQWRELHLKAGLTEVRATRTIPLYPVPFSLVFGRNLHVISLLKKLDPESSH
jgi:ubiquinone/menaquinone biosynthesis C-methylase UbiE